MLETRMAELFNNMLDYISDGVSGCDLKDVLNNIGFTDEEIEECGVNTEDE